MDGRAARTGQTTREQQNIGNLQPIYTTLDKILFAHPAEHFKASGKLIVAGK